MDEFGAFVAADAGFEVGSASRVRRRQPRQPDRVLVDESCREIPRRRRGFGAAGSLLVGFRAPKSGVAVANGAAGGARVGVGRTTSAKLLTTIGFVMTDWATTTFAVIVGFEPGFTMTTAVRHHPLAVGFAEARWFGDRFRVGDAGAVTRLDGCQVSAWQR